MQGEDSAVSTTGKYYRYDAYACYSRTKHKREMIRDPSCRNANWHMKDLDQVVVNEVLRLATDKEYFESLVSHKAKDSNTNECDRFYGGIKTIALEP